MVEVDCVLRFNALKSLLDMDYGGVTAGLLRGYGRVPSGFRVGSEWVPNQSSSHRMASVCRPEIALGICPLG
jgi:hypothetical protein